VAAVRVRIAWQDVAEFGVRLVGLQAEQHGVRAIALDTLKCLQQATIEDCLVAHVMIGRQQHQLRLGIFRQDVQQRVKNTDAGTQIARLHDQVAALQRLEQQRAIGPPLAMLLSDDGADAVRGDHALGPRNSIFQQGPSTVQ